MECGSLKPALHHQKIMGLGAVESSE